MSVQRPRFLHSFAALVLTSCCALLAHAQTQSLLDLASFPRSTLDVKRASGTTEHFSVWVASTPERQAQGLMFVRDLPAGEGMIFIHEPPRKASMWMKNTYIPLDMLFVGPDGRIVKIAAETRPHSLDTISSGESVKAVIEIGGGEAKRLRIAVGDRVQWPDVLATAKPML